MKHSRKTRFWAVAATVGAFVVAFSSVANNFSSAFNNLASLRKSPATTASGSVVVSQSPRSSSPDNQSPRASSALPTKTGFQVSTGAQSPNLRNVQKTVRLQYSGAQPHVNAQTGPVGHETIPAIRIPKASTVQISTGSQSPNIDGVGGDVDIRFVQTASSEGRSEHAQNAKD